MSSTKFSVWLEQKYIAWIAEAGQLRTLKEFAGWLGIGNAVLSHYIHGTRRPDPKQVEKIALKLGIEAYDLLNMPRPDPGLFKVKANWHILSEEQKRRIGEIVDEKKPKG